MKTLFLLMFAAASLLAQPPLPAIHEGLGMVFFQNGNVMVRNFGATETATFGLLLAGLIALGFGLGRSKRSARLAGVAFAFVGAVGALMAQPPARPARPQPKPAAVALPATQPHAVSIQVTPELAVALDKLIVQAKDKDGKPFESTDALLVTLIQQNVSLRLLRQFPTKELEAKREAVKKAQAELAAAETGAVRK